MDRDPRPRGEHQLEAPAAQLAGQAVAVHQHGGRLLAALGELDPVDLPGIEVLGRLPTFRRSGPKAPDTSRLSPLRITARKLPSPAGAFAARRLSCSICSTATRCVRPPAAIAMSAFSRKPVTVSPLASTTRASPRSPVPKRMLATAARGSTSAP